MKFYLDISQWYHYKVSKSLNNCLQNMLLRICNTEYILTSVNSISLKTHPTISWPTDIAYAVLPRAGLPYHYVFHLLLKPHENPLSLQSTLLLKFNTFPTLKVFNFSVHNFAFFSFSFLICLFLNFY